MICGLYVEGIGRAEVEQARQSSQSNFRLSRFSKTISSTTGTRIVRGMSPLQYLPSPNFPVFTPSYQFLLPHHALRVKVRDHPGSLTNQHSSIDRSRLRHGDLAGPWFRIHVMCVAGKLVLIDVAKMPEKGKDPPFEVLIT